MSMLILYLIMNPERMQALLNSRPFRYGIRVVVLYLLSAIFKSFDLTFPHDPRIITFRGQAFSLLYIVFGLVMWEGAVLLSGKIRRDLPGKRSALLIPALALFFILYGLLTAYLFGFFYGCFDVLFFRKIDAWESFSAFSYELNFSTFLFYLLIVGYNGAAFYYQGWQESRLKAESIVRENLKVEYETLRARLDPRFFYNSLTVLINLVHKSRDLAAGYGTHLARCCRFLTDRKFERLIPLADELDFLESYNFLLAVKYQHSIVFDISIGPQVRNFSRIPPGTLQLLVENAVKHTVFSVNHPLHIRIYEDGNYLYAENNVGKRKAGSMSTCTGMNASQVPFGKAGLSHLGKRYELTGGTGIEITEGGGFFIVRLPVL